MAARSLKLLIRIKLSLSLTGLMLASGCASFHPGSNVLSHTNPQINEYPLNRIAVLPFRNATDSPKAGTKVATFFYDQLSATTRFQVTPAMELEEDEEVKLEFQVRAGQEGNIVSPETQLEVIGKKVAAFLARIKPYLTDREVIYPGEYFEGVVPEREKDIEKTLREKLGPRYEESEMEAAEEEAPPLDAVVTGVVTRYRNRDGNYFAADSPASVAYELYMISVRDGVLLWSASFDETQQPLLDNLVYIGRYIKGGGGWQTHDTLSRLGMERVLSTFPGLQEKEEEPEKPLAKQSAISPSPPRAK